MVKIELSNDVINSHNESLNMTIYQNSLVFKSISCKLKLSQVTDLTLTYSQLLNLLTPFLKKNNNGKVYSSIKKKIKSKGLLTKEDFDHNCYYNCLIKSQKMLIYLTDTKNIKELLISSPTDLISLDDKILSLIDGIEYKELLRKFSKKKNSDNFISSLKSILNKIIDYSKLGNNGFLDKQGVYWNSYRLTSEIGINVCPYCNRNYINTVKDNKNKAIIRAQLDHFFCKSSYPLLALSIYNLIPSCYNCNSNLKGQTKFSLDKHLNPYIENYDSAKFRFYINHSDDKFDSSVLCGIDIDKKHQFEVKLTTKEINDKKTEEKILNNNSIFKIDDIYSTHQDIVSELITKRYLWDDNYLKNLSSQFGQFGLDDDEVYRLFIGNYKNEKDHSRRPLSKLTKDIFDQLGMK